MKLSRPRDSFETGLLPFYHGALRHRFALTGRENQLVLEELNTKGIFIELETSVITALNHTRPLEQRAWCSARLLTARDEPAVLRAWLSWFRHF